MPTQYVPADGGVNEQFSALPLMYGRHWYAVVVGLLPNWTYISASPVPPLIEIVALACPAGTSKLQNRMFPTVESDRPLCGTSLTSTPSPGGGGGGGPPPHVDGAVPTLTAAHA